MAGPPQRPRAAASEDSRCAEIQYVPHSPTCPTVCSATCYHTGMPIFVSPVYSLFSSFEGSCCSGRVHLAPGDICEATNTGCTHWLMQTKEGRGSKARAPGTKEKVRESGWQNHPETSKDWSGCALNWWAMMNRRQWIHNPEKGEGNRKEECEGLGSELIEHGTDKSFDS